MKDDAYLSLHALSDQPQQRSIQLRALVQNQALVILVDSEVPTLSHLNTFC
jgi:hypothetical protein